MHRGQKKTISTQSLRSNCVCVWIPHKPQNNIHILNQNHSYQISRHYTQTATFYRLHFDKSKPINIIGVTVVFSLFFFLLLRILVHRRVFAHQRKRPLKPHAKFETAPTKTQRVEMILCRRRKRWHRVAYSARPKRCRPLNAITKSEPVHRSPCHTNTKASGKYSATWIGCVQCFIIAKKRLHSTSLSQPLNEWCAKISPEIIWHKSSTWIRMRLYLSNVKW